MSSWIDSLKRAFVICRQWFSKIWDIDVRRLHGWQRPIAKLARMFELVWRGFRADDCQLHASSLTFRSLMAIVPVLAMSLALVRAFGDKQQARQQVLSLVDDFAAQLAHEEPSGTNANEAAEENLQNDSDSLNAAPSNGVVRITASADTPGGGGEIIVAELAESTENPDLVAATKLANELKLRANELFDIVEGLDFGKLGGVGLVMLLWMVISVLGKVEESFNRVWGVSKGRTLWRKFTDYLSVIIVMPLLATAASTLSVSDLLIGSGSEESVRWIAVLMPLFSSIGSWLVATLLFTFMLMFMPNTRVRVLPGIVGGMVVATLFICWITICTRLQIGVSKNDKLFGSFAIVPILLAWVYVSWEIILFGAEVAFAWQNADTFRMEKGAENASANAKVLTTVSLVHELARRMLVDEEVLQPTAFAHERCISIRLVNYSVDMLINSGMAAPVETEDDEGLVLLKSPDQLRVIDVVRMVLHSGISAERLGLQHEEANLPDSVMQWDEKLSDSLKRSFAELATV